VWFDSHCHLHLCDDPAGVVASATASGVRSLIAIGIDVESSERALALARAHDLWATAGVHPNSALEWDEDAARRIDGLLADERVVGVGETGLDFHWDDAPPDRQRAAFADHIALAKSHGKCLVIHTRESVPAALAMLEDAGPPARLVFHCWSGALDELARALALGAYVSFAGNVTFKSAPLLRQAAARVPDDRLLVETDSPFLTPVPHRGRPNQPAYLPFTGEVVARERDTSPDDVARLTADNARRAFGVPVRAG
jgi:TatD DNase family protein